jgi:hypothetical protein
MTTTMMFVCGVIGIALYASFVGFMVIWVKALPLIIIVVVCTALLIFDFYHTLRYGETHGRR